MATTEPGTEAPPAGKGKGKKGKGGKDAPEKKSKKKLFMIVGLVLVALVVKFVILKAPPPPTCEVKITTADTPVTTTTIGKTAAEQCTPPVAGAALVLDPITVNLADGHYLKLGLALQLAGTADAKVMTEEGGGAKALDAAIAQFSSTNYDQLIDPASRDEQKIELAKTVTEEYDGEVLNIYFTEFVMQ
ncbi:MAG: flagellar basal body-associated FliL family protein [Acidimicrobiia bacterium]